MFRGEGRSDQLLLIIYALRQPVEGCSVKKFIVPKFDSYSEVLLQTKTLKFF